MFLYVYAFTRMSSPVCYHLHHRVLQDLVGRSADELEMELHVAGTKPSKTTPKKKKKMLVQEKQSTEDLGTA